MPPCPTCAGRKTIRILSADAEPPQIVPCVRCSGTGNRKLAPPPPTHDKALRPDSRKPDAKTEWFNLWKSPAR
jgi:hypothetical protein